MVSRNPDETAAAWVDGFIAGWRAPAGADAFARLQLSQLTNRT